jgi:hypothetical protein
VIGALNHYQVYNSSVSFLIIQQSLQPRQHMLGKYNLNVNS